MPPTVSAVVPIPARGDALGTKADAPAHAGAADELLCQGTCGIALLHAIATVVYILRLDGVFNAGAD